VLDRLRERAVAFPVLGVREVEPGHAAGELRRGLEQASMIRCAGAQGVEHLGMARDALAQRFMFTLQAFQ
jgi:hypothetical protein